MPTVWSDGFDHWSVNAIRQQARMELETWEQLWDVGTSFKPIEPDPDVKIESCELQEGWKLVNGKLVKENEHV